MTEREVVLRERAASAIRESFVQHFGEDQAKAVEAAAEGHENEPNGTNKGSDEFRWAILIALGYQCMEVEGYRRHHGITADWPTIQQWIKDHGDLGHHDGDCDYIALFAGVYTQYVPKADEATA